MTVVAYIYVGAALATLLGACFVVVRAIWRAVWVFEAALRVLINHEARLRALERVHPVAQANGRTPS